MNIPGNTLKIRNILNGLDTSTGRENLSLKSKGANGKVVSMFHVVCMKSGKFLRIHEIQNTRSYSFTIKKHIYEKKVERMSL
jgi:hypothetical protein